MSARTVMISFNSRPSCDGRRRTACRSVAVHLVSIHARLATGDSAALVPFLMDAFQFTPVLRRATPSPPPMPRAARFNSRPSCDGRPSTRSRRSRSLRFNSRPSCDGRPARCCAQRPSRRFNSRPSCDGRLRLFEISLVLISFNSRPSCDGRLPPRASCSYHFCFNSRPSCDGRHRTG